MLSELVRIGEEGGSASLAELFANRLEQEPALAGYIRRLLVDGGEAGGALFEQLFETTLAGMRSLTGAQFVRPALDEQIRAAFLLANDLAMVLLRRQVERVIGVDPLTKDGLARWTAEAVDIYTNGLFTSPLPVTQPTPAVQPEERR